MKLASCGNFSSWSSVKIQLNLPILEMDAIGLVDAQQYQFYFCISSNWLPQESQIDIVGFQIDIVSF